MAGYHSLAARTLPRTSGCWWRLRRQLSDVPCLYRNHQPKTYEKSLIPKSRLSE